MTKAHQIEPPRCKKSMTVSEVRNTDWRGREVIAEVKEDGRRYLLQVRPNGANINYLTSRRQSVVTKEFVEKQDSVPMIRDHPFPARFSGLVFDGEIIANEKNATSNEAATAIANGDCTYIVWDVFDPSRPETIHNHPLHHRRDYLLNLSGFMPGWMRIVDTGKPVQLLNAVLNRGGEGVILKDLDEPYGKGWVKVKQEQTEDCVILGFEMSTEGKYAHKNWIGAAILGQWTFDKPGPKTEVVRTEKRKGQTVYLVNVGKTSGFTDQFRAELTIKRKEYVGQVMEIEANLRQPSGKFRNPRFFRMRDDKSPEQCLFTVKSDE